MSLGGAFDLSRFAPKTQENEGEKIPGPFITDVTEANLQQVMTLSTRVPILLAFYSARSENSAPFIASLTSLIEAQAGRLQLAKVDVDAQPALAQAFGVSGVPAVAALLQGNPIPMFQGLPDATQLEQSVNAVIDAGAQYGITGVLDGGELASEPELPPLHKEGQEALAAGNLDAARAAFTTALVENPRDEEAKVALAQVDLLRRLKVIDEMDPQTVVAKAQSAPRDDIDTQLMAADLEFGGNHPDVALARLLDVIKVVGGDQRELVRQRILEYFELLGPTSELVTQGRKTLANTLF